MTKCKLKSNQAIKCYVIEKTVSDVIYQFYKDNLRYTNKARLDDFLNKWEAKNGNN